MRGKCERCGAVGVGGISCDEGYVDYAKCPHFQAESGKRPALRQEGERVVPWTGNTLGVRALSFVAARGPTRLIGLLGHTDAGKSTFLSLFYLLLARGNRFPAGRFAGSYTLEGWDNLARSLRLQSPDRPAFPPHTPSGSGRVPGLLHLALREPQGALMDLILTDASGEWFENWAANEGAESAAGARWIAEHAHAFLLFIDCARLSESPVQAAKTFAETVRLAQRLRDHAQERRVGLVWAKSDREPIPKFRERLESRLSELFPDAKSFWVSTEMVRDPALVSRYLEAVAWAAASGPFTQAAFPDGRDLGADPFYQIGRR